MVAIEVATEVLWTVVDGSSGVGGRVSRSLRKTFGEFEPRVDQGQSEGRTSTN